MFNLVLDPNFYITFSFVFLILWGILKLKGKVSQFLGKRIDSISRSINNAACEKDKALLYFTRMNSSITKLPDDIVKIWGDYVVDFNFLHRELDEALKKTEKLNNLKLDYIQRLRVQKEYDQFLYKISQQFKFDIQTASIQKKNLILTQAIDLLDTVQIKS